MVCSQWCSLSRPQDRTLAQQRSGVESRAAARGGGGGRRRCSRERREGIPPSSGGEENKPSNFILATSYKSTLVVVSSTFNYQVSPLSCKVSFSPMSASLNVRKTVAFSAPDIRPRYLFFSQSSFSCASQMYACTQQLFAQWIKCYNWVIGFGRTAKKREIDCRSISSRLNWRNCLKI